MLNRLLALLALAIVAAPAAAFDIKNSTTPGNSPTLATPGEIAINRADKSLFFKNVDGTIGVGSLLNANAAGRQAVEQGKADSLSVGGVALPSALAVKAPLASPTFTGIATAPVVNLTGQMRATVSDLVTSQTTPGGSVGEGLTNIDVIRTGGFGQYGNVLSRYHITAATPAGQFDVGETAWVTHTNLTGGQVFGGWFGSNTPSSGNNYSGAPLNQTYSGGAAVGAEINAGNRWADFGLQSTIGGTRYTVGLQVVPDVLPARDGPTTQVYPGTFGVIVGKSVHGHKWWTGLHVPADAIMPGGFTFRPYGGSSSANAPSGLMRAEGFYLNGVDFSTGTFGGNVLGFAAGQQLGVVGGGTINLAGNLTMDGVAWASYTPALTASSGTITTAGAASGAYHKIGKTVVVRITAPITTNGTAAGSLSITLPPGLPVVGNQPATFVEDLVTGQPAFGIAYANATAITAIRKADGTYPGGDGRRFIGSITYQTN